VTLAAAEMLVAVAALVGRQRQARPLRLLGQSVRPLENKEGGRGGKGQPDDPDFIVLADTEGNRFCIVNLGREHHPPGQDS
jgi:hypothetical protein